jgi:preprotein translocase subunit SecF
MIELFKQPNIDWMGKAKYFFALSGILLAIGWAAIFFKGGIKYGIDFKGGTNVDVIFAQPPNVDKLRSSLRAQGLNNTEIQGISSSAISTSHSNEVLIFVEQAGQNDQAIDNSKTKVLDALDAAYGVSSGSKPDFNSTSTNALANFLSEKDPLGLSVGAGNKYQVLASNLLAFRDKDKNGVIDNFSELSQASGAAPAVVSAIEQHYSLAPFAIRNVEIVGPKVGAELRNQAIRVTLYALAGMLVYIAFRFYGGQIGGSTGWAAKGAVGALLRFVDRIIFGVAAVLAVFHDVLITLGLFKIFGFEISLTVIAALLTLVGYSMNDTIVIFDRIRENNRLLRKEPFSEVVNKSINQTLSRTILTSGLTFLTVLVLFLMGGQVLRAFSFALVVGIVVGTYSSFGIAAPLVVAWNRWRGHSVAAGTGTAAGNKTRGSEGGTVRLAPAGRR